MLKSTRRLFPFLKPRRKRLPHLTVRVHNFAWQRLTNSSKHRLALIALFYFHTSELNPGDRCFRAVVLCGVAERYRALVPDQKFPFEAIYLNVT
jgi:hypothetical protein